MLVVWQRKRSVKCKCWKEYTSRGKSSESLFTSQTGGFHMLLFSLKMDVVLKFSSVVSNLLEVTSYYPLSFFPSSYFSHFPLLPVCLVFLFLSAHSPFQSSL